MGMTPFQYREALAAIHEAESRHDVPSDPELERLIAELVRRIKAAEASMQLEVKSTAQLIAISEVKAISDDTVRGYAAVTGNLDKTKDIIQPGAFADTVRDAKTFAQAHHSAAIYPLLWQHDAKDTIGGIMECREDPHGLLISAKCDLSIEHGRQAYNGLVGGYLSFSIGYKPAQYKWVGKIRHLLKIDLSEVSVVTWPANPEARAIPD